MLDKIKWFWRYYKHYPYILAVLLILTPVQALFQVAIPRLIEFTVDFVKSGQVPSNRVAVWINATGESFGLSSATTFFAAIIIMGLIATALYTYVQSHRAWMNFKLEWLFRQDAFAGVALKGPDFFNQFRTGDLVTRMTDDVAEKLSWFACSGIFRFYEALLMVIFTLVMMVSINPILTLWTAVPLPLLIVVFFISATVLDKRYDHLQTRISKLNAIVEACLSGIRVVKAYVQEKAQKHKFGGILKDRRNAEISAIKATVVVDSLYMYIWQFGIIIVLLAGGYMAINAKLSLGELIAFVYYVIYLIFPMFSIGQFLVKSRQSAISIERLVKLEKVPVMVSDTGRLKVNRDQKCHLVLSDVGFAFPDSNRKILDGVSFEIKPGQIVALVGKVGSGKSWLVNIIPRLVDPTRGGIKLDGHDLREYRLAELRKLIGYVPQEPALFSDTIHNNIVFGRDDINEADIEWAVEISQLKDEIDSFPKGLDTQIGTRGVSLSGGQKQRLALARALVGKPKILILDDCTSALDSRTETALWERLGAVLPGMTVILITHRPDMLQKADKIFVMADGSLVESGTHFELLLKDSFYARLYKRYQLEQQVSEVV